MASACSRSNRIRDVQLLSRNRLPQNCPPIAEAIAKPAAARTHSGWRGDLGRQEWYHVFDVLWLDGRDVMLLPLEERRVLLDTLDFRPPLQRVITLGDSQPWETACREGWEGVIAKRRDSLYEHRRSPHWLKMKCEASQEFVVGGFTDPQGGRVGLGALLVGYFEKRRVRFCRQSGHGVRYQTVVGTSRAAWRRSRFPRLRSPKVLGCHACGRTGQSPSWSCRWASLNGPCMASCDIPAF